MTVLGPHNYWMTEPKQTEEHQLQISYTHDIDTTLYLGHGDLDLPTWYLPSSWHQLPRQMDRINPESPHPLIKLALPCLSAALFIELNTH